jgi:hypothetical protein
MSVFSMHLRFAKFSHPEISVEANVRSRLCRSQNPLEGIAVMAKQCGGVDMANLRSRLCRSQSRRIQRRLPV